MKHFQCLKNFEFFLTALGQSLLGDQISHHVALGPTTSVSALKFVDYLASPGDCMEHAKGR
jgi:hypothetical protein